MDVEIYISGCCRENTKNGGYAAIALFENGETWQISRGYVFTTTERMELFALISALERLKNSMRHLGDDLYDIGITVYTDSKFIGSLINNRLLIKWDKCGWQEDIGLLRNLDLLKSLVVLVKEFKNIVIGNKLNYYEALCRQLAECASEVVMYMVHDVEYENNFCLSNIFTDSNETCKSRIEVTEQKSEQKRKPGTFCCVCKGEAGNGELKKIKIKKAKGSGSYVLTICPCCVSQIANQICACQ